MANLSVTYFGILFEWVAVGYECQVVQLTINK